MKIYFAPLEGITTSPFRNAHAEIYKGVSKYYIPFINVTESKGLSRSEKYDLSPEGNMAFVIDQGRLVPQLMGKNPEFLAGAVRRLEIAGYPEVNLNLGCPSPTVTRRGRGAGLLSDPKAVDKLLDGIFRRLDGTISVSVKTRIGMDQNVTHQLINVYNQYPLSEVTIHPRLGSQGYGGAPDLNSYGEALEASVNPIVYNGDILTYADAKAIVERFPKTSAIMIGRGMVMKPALAESILGIMEEDDRMQQFHDRILSLYKDAPADDGGTIARMKELWGFWVKNFEEADGRLPHQIKKNYKALKKSKSMEEYILESHMLLNTK
ncbi:MAG: tRNA dihydrouridine synthase [Bilifractor sp.]